jgi:hypothetical protein
MSFITKSTFSKERYFAYSYLGVRGSKRETQQECSWRSKFTILKNINLSHPDLPCLHSHFSNPSVSSPLGSNYFAVFYLLHAPKFLFSTGVSIKLSICRISGLFCPSHITLTLNSLSQKRSSLIIMSDAKL